MGDIRPLGDLPPIPHPELRKDVRPGPVIVRFDWNGDHDPGAQSIGSQQLFGPFESVWVWGDTIIGRTANHAEYSLAAYRVSEAHGGGVWRAADDLYYTDVVFLHVANPADSNLAVQLLGSLIIKDVEQRVREVTD